MIVGRGRAAWLLGRASCALLAFTVGAVPLGAQGSPLALSRIDTMTEPVRAQWRAYLARSHALDSSARAAMSAELRSVGRERMTRAPFSAESFVALPSMDRRWAASDSGRRVVANVLSFQTPSGGWSKHLDLMSHERAAGQSYFSESDEWQWVGTIDQGSTTSEIRFLLAVAPAGSPAGQAAVRGLEYLLGAQMPDGCWPQVYPLMGGYHDAIAIADDANVHVLALLREIAAARDSVIDTGLRTRAGESYRRGVACVVRLQQRATAPGAGWALFHDPLSGAPLPGRSYEPAALAPLETAALLDELMAGVSADSATVDAAHAAAAWLRREGLSGWHYEAFALTRDTTSGLVWPRLVSLDDGRPVFSNRDGISRRDWAELTDRRTGYIWFGTAPVAVLERYAAWAATHSARGAYAPARVPTDSIATLPGHGRELDTSTLLSEARLSRLTPAARAAWMRYRARSRELSVRDHAAVNAELASAGLGALRRAAWTHDFEGMASMPWSWFLTDTARRVGESILSFQTPSGGWSKHVDFRAGVRLPGVGYNGETADWHFVPTIDNGSTTEELRFLSRADSVHHDQRYADAFARGVRYLLAAQMPNGCWPQVFPLEGGYHDAATFNDDAIVHAAALLREVGAGTHALADTSLRRASAAAVRRAVGCMLDAQVLIAGRRTVWGQQHDPLTLRPIRGRSYELAALTGDESAAIATFLLEEPAPTARVTAAVNAAAAWFRANAISGLSYSHYELRRVPDAAPLWGRMVEMNSGKPIFANRDGIMLYDYDKLTDRRTGYRWFTAAPRAFLRSYDSVRAAARTDPAPELSTRPR
jgi:PelA/Pel-15E family pectate lyase